MGQIHLDSGQAPKTSGDFAQKRVPAAAPAVRAITSVDATERVATGATARAKRTVADVLAEAGSTIGGPNPWDIQVKDPSFYTRLLRDPDLELGVTYMDGLWDCPAIDQLCARLMESGAAWRILQPDSLLRTPVLLAQAAAHRTYRWVRDSLTNRQNRERSTTVAKEHYDAGNLLYAHQLGPTMAYTSGVFAPGYDLEDAQNAKHDLLCRKMGLKPGDRVLDIGCGFGGFARFAAQHYGAEVVGLTISNEQLRAARALSEGTPNVSFLYSDYRDIPRRFPKDHFDHVVSIEMIEAVGPKNLTEYFDCAQACLKRGGSFALQAICQNYDVVNSNAWFSKYIFQEGVAPSRRQVDTAAASFFGAPEDLHRFNDGYDKTLLAWHANFERSWPELADLYDDRFKRMWDFYLRSVAGGFRCGVMNVDQVVYRKGGPRADVSPVRELPSRVQLDAWRASPAQAQAIVARMNELEGHAQAVRLAAAPKRAAPEKPLDRDARICVVGAGPSGLSVAKELEGRGYTNVVVLEAADRVGGKSATTTIGGRLHDLGATMGVPRKYDDVVTLGEAHGVRTTAFPEQVQYDLSTGAARPPKTFSELAGLYAGAVQYLVTNMGERGKSGPGLEVPSENLAEPFGILAARHGFVGVGDTLDTYLTGYGYGFPSTTPAVYAFRMLSPDAMIGAGTQDLLMWENGTTPIWEGVAKELDVRFGTPVKSVDRSGGKVVVETRAGRMEFDRLVMACDPTQADFLDATAEEKSLFANIRHMPYSTFACRVKGVADGRAEVGYLRENMNEERVGHPMAWIKRYADDDVFVFHLFAPEGMSDQQVMAKIRDDMTKLGATSVELCEARRWKFFPHVDGDAMRMEKFFERAKNLQGERGTFYANEALSMSTMADVHAFAKVIAERVAQSG